MNKIFKINFAFFLLIFIHTTIAQDEARISSTWQVQKFEITPTLPQNETDRNLAVKAKIDLKNVSARPAATLTLRISTAAEIASVNINGSSVQFTKGEEKVNAAVSLQRIVIRVPSVQPNASISATVDYKLAVKENSGLSSISPGGSQFLPMSFWYPTPNSWFFSRGADLAPFKLAVNGAGGQTLLSSGSGGDSGGYDQKLNGQPFLLVGSGTQLRQTAFRYITQKAWALRSKSVQPNWQPLPRKQKLSQQNI